MLSLILILKDFLVIRPTMCYSCGPVIQCLFFYSVFQGKATKFLIFRAFIREHNFYTGKKVQSHRVSFLLNLSGAAHSFATEIRNSHVTGFQVALLVTFAPLKTSLYISMTLQMSCSNCQF